jgi:hypothetical protein
MREGVDSENTVVVEPFDFDSRPPWLSLDALREGINLPKELAPLLSGS